MQRRRELVEQAQHRRRSDRGDDPSARFGELDLGLGPVAGLDPVADPPHQVGLAGGGPAMQRRAAHRASRGAAGPAGNRGTGRAGAGSAPGLRGPRRRGRAVRSPRASGRRAGRRRPRRSGRGQLAQHRAAQQEGAQLRRHGPQHLGEQVVEDVAVAAAVGDAGLAPVGGRFGGARRQAVHRQAQPDRPALGALEQAPAGRGRVDVRRQLRQQGPHLVEVEAQVALAELGQLVVRAQPRQRQRRLGAARRDDHAPLRRQPLEQQVEELEHRRVADPVRVVDHDQAARHLAGGERVEQLAGHGAAIAAAAAGHRHQGLGVGAPGRVERLERGAQAGEQAERVVAGIDRDPGHRGLAGKARDQAASARRSCRSRQARPAAPGACRGPPRPAAARAGSRRTRPARGRGAWILVSANEGEAMAACGGKQGYFADRGEAQGERTAGRLRAGAPSRIDRWPSIDSTIAIPASTPAPGWPTTPPSSARSSSRRRPASGSARSCAATAP